MSKTKELMKNALQAMRKRRVRPDIFFEECMDELKQSSCPLIVKKFEEDVEKIKSMSCACVTIERLHIEQKLKKYSGDLADLFYLHLIKISDYPLAQLKEGVSLQLGKMMESVSRVSQRK